MTPKERSKAWYYANHERNKQVNRERSREFRRLHPERKLLAAAKQRARLGGLSFDIDETDVSIPAVCPVFGVPMLSGTRYAPSVDRIDSAGGYTKGNVQVISKLANTMKADATVEELRAFAAWLNH